MLLAACLVTAALGSGRIDWDPREGAPRRPCGWFLGHCDEERRRDIERYHEECEEQLRQLMWLVGDPRTPLDVDWRRPLVGRIRRRSGLEE